MRRDRRGCLEDDMLVDAVGAPPRARSIRAILTQLFLRRFLENDLLGAASDRTQVMALVGAGLFTGSLFVSFATSALKYVVGVHTPGEAALDALDDRFFYITASMLVAALAASFLWEALGIEPRDAAILEPLPLRTATIRQAKAAAVATFGVAAAVVVNLAPSIIFPWLLVIRQQVHFVETLALIATHAAVTMAAAAFGYVTILALRELLAALCGRRLFRVVSPLAQGALVVALGGALLLLPLTALAVERRVLGAAAVFVPPAWFLGAYEQIAGRVLIDAPRGVLTPPLARADAQATATYRQHQVQFGRLAMMAPLSLLAGLLLAAGAYAWNAGRSTTLAPGAFAVRRRRSRWLRQLVRRLFAPRDPIARAGWLLALATIWRSAPHRLALACAAAVGVAIAVGVVSGFDATTAASGGRPPAALLAVQPLLAGALILGFRHAIRVPAELRANWAIHLAWRNRRYRFVAGVRRAGLLALAVPALAVTWPLNALVLGPRAALVYATFALAGSALLLEAVLHRYAGVPFASAYAAQGNMKALAPIYALAFLLAADAFGRISNAALATPDGTIAFLTVLLTSTALLRWTTARVAREFSPDPFDDTQESRGVLGLQP